MAEKRSNLHKTLLILLLVFTPPFWLLFTDEGARVSDTALLWLLGEEEIRVSLEELDSGFSDEDIRTVYGGLDWQCGSQPSDFGDRLCAGRIGTFNGYPAQLVTFYFRDGRVTAMQLRYRRSYHAQLLGYLIGEFGQPGNVAAALAEGPDAAAVLEWPLDRGRLYLKKELAGTDEPALLWLATAPAG